MNVSQGFPVPAAPLIDADGNITDAWRRFFLTLWNRTGEGPGISSADLELLQALFSARVELHTAAEIEAQGAFLGALAARSTPRASQALDVAMMALLKRRVVSAAEIVAALASNAGASAGKLLIGNTTSGGFNLAALTAGSNITITNGNGSVSISAAGGGSGSVTSVGLTSTDFVVSGSPVTTSGNIVANLGNTAVTAGTYGDATHVAQLTLDAKGRATAAANVAILTVTSTASGSTITPNSAYSQYEVTALAAAATIAAPSGSPVDGQKLILRLKDDGTARALTWTTSAGAYRAVGVTLPTTTVISKVLYVGCIYNGQDTFWDVVAVAEQ